MKDLLTMPQLCTAAEVHYSCALRAVRAGAITPSVIIKRGRSKGEVRFFDPSSVALVKAHVDKNRAKTRKGGGLPQDKETTEEKIAVTICDPLADPDNYPGRVVLHILDELEKMYCRKGGKGALLRL